MAAQQPATLFPYPTAPDDIPTLSGKCNYLVYNFWDRCNIKESFSSLNRLNDAFGMWASFMPYATADTVHLAVENYIKKVEKQSPKNLVEVGRMAQNWFYCDTAQYPSDEVYMQFCQAMVNGKKVPNADKALYAAQLKVLESSSIGQRVPAFSYTRSDGSTASFADDLASRIVLFINDPDCIDCTLAKARLSADFSTNKLMDAGLLKIVCIYPGEPSDEWREKAQKYPEGWIIGAYPDLDQYFDLTNIPSFYWLDGGHKVIGKDVPIDNLIYLIQQIYTLHNQ